MSATKLSAKDEYMAAFERLKLNKPIKLPKGTLVTQNNVAREAGKDPSAFKKERFPTEVLLVQAYIEVQNQNIQSKKRTPDNRSRDNKEKIEDYRKQIDRLTSIVYAQNSTIEELLAEIERLNEQKILRVN